MTITQICGNYLNVFNPMNLLITKGAYLGLTTLAMNIISKIPTVKSDIGGPDPEGGFDGYWTERAYTEAREGWKRERQWEESRSFSDLGGRDIQGSFGGYSTEQGPLEAREEEGPEERWGESRADFGDHVSNFGGHALDLANHFRNYFGRFSILF